MSTLDLAVSIRVSAGTQVAVELSERCAKRSGSVVLQKSSRIAASVGMVAASLGGI